MLIQKDVKLQLPYLTTAQSLRALLIQKDVKLLLQRLQKGYCLRALLIQKDVKLDTLCGVECLFESFVNSERCKTRSTVVMWWKVFESFVNSERCKTVIYFSAP